MEVNADLDLLKKKIEQTISNFQKWKSEDKRKTTFVKTYGGLVSGLTTILIGLSSYLPDNVKGFSIAALITSASLTVVQTWDNLFNHKRLWLIEAEALAGFYELRGDLLHLEASGTIDQNAINICYERYKQIYRTWNSAWSELRNPE
jgi:hypothetical protein